MKTASKRRWREKNRELDRAMHNSARAQNKFHANYLKRTREAKKRTATRSVVTRMEEDDSVRSMARILFG